MRVAFLTNSTTRVNVAVLESLGRIEDVEIAHIFFYDTLTAVRRSPANVLRQFGVRRVAAKATQLLMSRLRMFAGSLLGPTRMKAKSAAEYAALHRLPRSTVADMNAEDVVAQVGELNLDVLLVCGCKNILKRKLLSTPGLKAINIHPSMLPKYRGPSPTFWMLYHEEKETGVTFHEMTPQIDAGAILYQRAIPLDATKTEREIETELLNVAAEALPQVLMDAVNNDAPVQPQSNESASYHPSPTPAERKELEQRLESIRKRR